MAAITVTDLTNAKLDVDHIKEVATSGAPTAVDRFGTTKRTLSGAIANVGGMNNRGAWAAATAYALKDLVFQSGTWYLCVVAHTSSGSFSTDVASKWRVHAGVTTADLEASDITDGLGYKTGTVSDRFKEQATIKDYGAAGAGADDTDEINAALAARREVYVPDDQFETGGLVNTRGAEFAGPGAVVKAITGGKQRLNLTADRGQHFFGQEYLYAFHQAIWAQFNGASAKVVCSGDSTTYGIGGNGATSPFLISDLVRIGGANAGYKVTAVNRGQPGQNTYHWRTTYLAGDLSEAPDLLVLRWGINDPGWLKTNVPPPIDSGQDYPNRRDIGDFETDLRAGLTAIRAARGVDSLSILLMTPNSTADTPNGRDELWYEQVRLVVRQAARDFKCAFIDTYSLWVDSRVAAGLWMDDPMPTAGRAIHPHNIMNAWIGSAISQFIYPSALRPSFLPGSYGTQPAASKPNDFKIGLNLHRIAAGDGFPGGLDGAVMTIRTADDITLQMAFESTDSTPPKMPAIRTGANGAWNSWVSQVPADVVATNGWVAFETLTTIRASKSWKVVSLSGSLKSGTSTAGTVVCTLPAGFRPYANSRFVVSCGAAFDTAAFLEVQPSGNVVIKACPSNGGLSLDGITFEAFN